MVYLDTPVLDTFDSYFEAVMYKNLCTITRAKQIVTDFVRHLRTLDVLFCTDHLQLTHHLANDKAICTGSTKTKRLRLNGTIYMINHMIIMAILMQQSIKSK